MAGELQKLNGFVGAARLLTKISSQTELVELYRAEGETFLMDAAVYVDQGKVNVRNGPQGLWTDGAGGGCTALAVATRGKVVLAHVVAESNTTSDETAEQKMLRSMAPPTAVAMAIAPGPYAASFTDDESARESSLFAALAALEAAFPRLQLQDFARMTTIITGFSGRDWTHECVLAAHPVSGIGFFMGADKSELLDPREQWRVRRNSYNNMGALPPPKKMKGLRFKNQ
jgi:hypothetical protein